MLSAKFTGKYLVGAALALSVAAFAPAAFAGGGGGNDGGNGAAGMEHSYQIRQEMKRFGRGHEIASEGGEMEGGAGRRTGAYGEQRSYPARIHGTGRVGEGAREMSPAANGYRGRDMGYRGGENYRAENGATGYPAANAKRGYVGTDQANSRSAGMFEAHRTDRNGGGSGEENGW